MNGSHSRRVVLTGVALTAWVSCTAKLGSDTQRADPVVVRAVTELSSSHGSSISRVPVYARAIVVPQNNYIWVSVRFRTDKPNRVRLLNAAGEVQEQWENKLPQKPAWQSPLNTTTRPVFYYLEVQHQVKPEQWQDNAEKLLVQKDISQKLGYEDGDNQDFQDVIVTLFSLPSR